MGEGKPPKMLGEKGHGESERLLYEGERANRRSCRARHEGGWAKNPHSPPRETEPRGVDLRGRRRGRLWLTLRLVLRPLQRHTRAALRPQDVLGALQAQVDNAEAA